MKNAFYFTLKALFVIRYLTFSLNFLIMYRNHLIRKIRLILKFMTSEPGKQTIGIQTLPSISRSQCNQTMKFLLKNHTENVTEKLFPDTFLKKKNWAYLWINSLKFYTVCFYCMPSWGLSKYTETKLQTTCFYLTWSFFKKPKEVRN